MAKTWKTWTRKEDARLEELRLQGLSCTKIAQMMDRTPGSIKCHLQEKDYAKGRSDAWYKILSQPHTLKGAAEAMGTTVWAVKQAKRKLRRAGFVIPNATWKDGKVRRRAGEKAIRGLNE